MGKSKKYKKRRNNKKYRPGREKKMRRVIYTSLMIIVLSLVLVGFIFLVYLIQAFHLRDPQVVATTPRASFLLLVPLFVFIVGGVVSKLEAKRIGEDYVFPAKYRRKMCLIYCGILVAALFLAGFGIFGREDLTVNNEVKVYNCFNVCTRTVPLDDMESVRIIGYYKAGAKTADEYAYAVEFKSNSDSKYAFDCDDFFGTHAEIIEIMQGIKDALPDKAVTIDGVEDLDRIVRDQQLDEETAAALRHLFDAE